MRHLRFLIPLIVFLISATISAGRAITFRNNISRVVNAADRNGYPIVVASSTRDDFKLAVYTIDEHGALLVTNSIRKSTLDCWFDNSGVLHYLVADPLIDQTIKFPDYRPIGEYRSGFINLMPVGYPTRYGITNNGQVRYGIYTVRKFIQIEDRLAETVMSIPLVRLVGLQRLQLPFGHFYGDFSDAYSAENSIYALEGKWAPRKSNLLRFDIETGQWAGLYTGRDRDWVDIFYGRNASLIALSVRSQENVRSTYVINGVTGEPVQVLEDTASTVIGRRWIAGLGITEDDSVSIYLYDMYNDWERHEIELLDYGRYSINDISWTLALYEPESTLHPDD